MSLNSSLSCDIIIPQYNNAIYTLNCLQSIKEFTEEGTYRVILIDNGSDKEELDTIREILSEINSILIENDENLGFVKAVNMGIGRSTAPYICILNDDTRVEKDWLPKMLEVFEQYPDCGMVGPTTIYAASWQNREEIKKNWIPDERDWPPIRPLPLGMLAFFCTIIKREVIQKVGYLSEEYGIGFGDDDDYAMRCREKGYGLCLRTDVTVPHFHRTTFKKYIPEYEELAKENLRYFKNKWGIE